MGPTDWGWEGQARQDFLSLSPLETGVPAQTSVKVLAGSSFSSAA